METYLRYFVGEESKSWLKWISWIEHNYNTNFHSAIDMMPYEAVFRKKPPTLLTYVLRTRSLEAVRKTLRDRDSILRDLRFHLEHTQAKIEHFYDKKHKDVQFQVGDRVFLKLRLYWQSLVAIRRSPKIFPRRVLFLKVPETRKALLLSEIDPVAQDFKVHLRSLPQIVESWNRSEDADPQPSQFARSLTKEVGFLQRVLSRTLHEADVQAIFRQVVIIFHSQISEAFSRLDISTPQAKDRLKRDVKDILGCIRSLPSDNLSKSGTPNWGQLDEFLVQRFGSEAS